MTATTGYNVVTLARGEQKSLRVTVENPPAGGIGSWADDLKIQIWDSVLEDPILTKTTGFTIVDAADTFEWLPEAEDTLELVPKVYTYRISLAASGSRIAFGPLIIQP